ncbi:MAG: tRNA lysidine(34) synthetase TilS [Phycisphaerales bacterium]
MNDASGRHPDKRSSAASWRQDDLVAPILRRWRQLTGDKNTRDDHRRTLVACSGGADSVALAFVIAQIPGSCVIAHIQHDIRHPEHTHADRELVESLAQRCGVPFTHAPARVTDLPGNLEANAREARYQALQQLAAEQNCPFIATAHHADDQLETLMINLMRGSGLRAMGGMDPATSLGSSVLIRPMLEITRDEILAFLSRASLKWNEDETNQDTSYTRNQIRHQLLPVMRKIDTEIAQHAAQWAADFSQAQQLVDTQVTQILARASRKDQRWTWDRSVLSVQPSFLLGFLPGRFCIDELNRIGLDKITRRAIEAWSRAVKSDSTDPTTHRIGPIVAHVDAHSVCIEPAKDNDQSTGAHV